VGGLNFDKRRRRAAGRAEHTGRETMLADGLGDDTQHDQDRSPSALIGLIEAHLGEAFDAAQAAEVRHKLAGRAALEDALRAELSAGPTGDGHDAPPAVTGFDDLIRRIDALAADLRRSRRRALLMRCGLAVAMLAIAAAIVLWPTRLGRQSPGPIGGRDGGPDRPGGATRPASRPASRPATRPGRVGPVTTWPDVDLSPGRMTWQEYAVGGVAGQSDWQADVGKLFEKRDGKPPVMSRDRRYLQLEGTYRLGSVPGPGRMLRLGHADGKQLDLEVWNGNAAVRLQIAPSKWTIQARALTWTDTRSSAVVRASCDDRGAWRWYGYGAIDIRYQDGRILVCRGEVPLLAVPMPKAPVGANLTCARSRLWLAEVRACRPLPLPADWTGRHDATTVPVVNLTWAQKSTDTVTFSGGRGGEVALAAESEKDAGYVWADLDVGPLEVVEVTAHVRQCTALAGVAARVGDVVRPIRLTLRKDKRLVAPRDSRHADDDLAAGRTVGEQFWVRIRFGLDAIMVWVSRDGKAWWPRQAQLTYGRGEKVWFGLEVQRGKEPRRVAVDVLEVRRSNAIGQMVRAEADLVREAGGALTYEITNATTREQALAMLDEARRDNVDPARWQAACDVHLVCGSRQWQVRLEALEALFLAECDRDAEADLAAILAGVRELQDAALVYPDRLPGLLREVVMTLARSAFEGGRMGDLKAVVDATYLHPGGPAGLSGGYHSAVMPPALLRLFLLGLMDRGDWASVRLAAARAVFTVPRGYRPETEPFARWALKRAREQLNEDPGAATGTQGPRCPLVLSDERLVLNVVGQFLFLVRGKHYQAACEKITSEPLDDALIRPDPQRDVLQATHFCVSQTIRTTPKLQDILTQPRFSQIGMIRLERARKQDDLDAVRALAAQFYGTLPALSATHVLADRDLSDGQFRSAIARYDLLRGRQDYPRREDAAAKFRLASAMLGRLAGDPVTKTVVLPGGTFSADQFERMVRQLAAERKPQAVPPSRGARAPGPAAHSDDVTLTRLADVTGLTARFRYTRARPADFATDGRRLFVSYLGKLLSIDPASPSVAWAFEPDPKRARYKHGHYFDAEGPAGLLRAGNRLYVRCTRGERPLECFHTQTGKRLWSRTYDTGVLSDPFLIGPWVSVITGDDDARGALCLQRTAKDADELSLSSRIVDVRDEVRPVGRPAVVGDAVLFRAAGCLINCDRRGTLRWARPLRAVPEDVLPELHTSLALDDMIVLDGRRLILTAPGCPYVTCVSADSGKRLWSFLIHSPSRLAGLVGGSAVVVDSERITALDPATGKIRWQLRHTAEGAAILPAGQDTLVMVRLRKPANSRDTSAEGRFVRWISAASGRTVRQAPLHGENTLYGVCQLFTDGKRIFGLSNFDGRRSAKAKLFMIEPTATK